MSSPSAPQSIQKLLDENAQLIRALVENMNNKGKAREIIQYQQNLHKNLVFLASLADPSLNVQAVLPPPGSMQRQMSDAAASQSGGGGAGGVSNHMTTSSQKQSPQATPSTSSVTGPSTSEILPMRQPAPGGHYASVAGTTGQSYGGSMWGGGQGQPGDPYAMQRSQLNAMGGGYQMGLSPDQRLRMRQEQMIQAQQQAHRMQQAGGGAMYPGAGQPPPPGIMPPQSGMPPGYPQGAMNPHSMPPGTRPMKMH